jgi:hypothetical protein
VLNETEVGRSLFNSSWLIARLAANCPLLANCRFWLIATRLIAGLLADCRSLADCWFMADCQPHWETKWVFWLIAISDERRGGGGRFDSLTMPFHSTEEGREATLIPPRCFFEMMTETSATSS